jgi:3-deoxy-D-manno-octulosonic-acid transferase
VYFLVRGVTNPAYLRRFRERLGFLPRSYRQTEAGAIWLHAVSVGEVLSAVELGRRLREALPRAPLFVSVATLAGRAAAEAKLAGIAAGVFYAPLDYCSVARRVLRRLQPQAVVVMETEIWPNLYREAKRSGCALVVVNGRISDAAAPRYRRWRWFFRQVLAWPDAILAQNEASAQRYAELGAERVRVAGNLKYDFQPGRMPEAVQEFIAHVAPRQVWIAASTVAPAVEGDPDEDEAVADAFLALARPGLLLILAPRQPARFDAAAGVLRRRGIRFVRRSKLDELELPGVLLVDTIGELSSLFGLADVVFMGGTLAQRGGHNILEPALAARPIVAGPHMENFREIARKFSDAGALRTIASAAELSAAVGELLDDPAQLGAKAAELAENERGATARALEEIERQYWRAVPVRLAPALLWPLGQLWLAGAWWKRRFARRERLRTPVISIGGITAGGTGKTPFVRWLAGRLKAEGLRPAILTRGYRRRAAERCTILGPGESAEVARTGDEAQCYLRAAVGPVGISADRALAGRRIEERFAPDVFLLDDGFQHHRLERATDIVLIDALNPFGGGQPLPLGRLREDPAALARADIVVVTRLEEGCKIDGIEAAIRRYNSKAPIYTARVEPEAWRPEAPRGAVAAFCGLGNPSTFWRTLEGMGIEPVFRRAFADHHRYTAAELGELAECARAGGATALVTTEKDFFNLPEGWQAAVPSVPLLWLEIRLVLDREKELVSALGISASNKLKG